MDPVLMQSVPTLAVAIIYCLWRWAYSSQLQRQHVLRERIAFMLWTAALEVE